MNGNWAPAPLAAAALLAAVSAAAAWWTFVFCSRLPLERALREKEADLDSARRLAVRLLDTHALARRPAS